jgi:tetratricopeptide (TPR) repeat protein
VRLAGLLHGADGAGPDRRLGGLVRRPDVPAADRGWVRLPTASLDPAQALYEAGEYAQAADLGRELLEYYPSNPRLLYNTACCESLAERAEDAVGHLRRAANVWDGCRDMARGDSDFDPIRDEPAFREFVGG